MVGGKARSIWANFAISAAKGAAVWAWAAPAKNRPMAKTMDVRRMLISPQRI
jgi:hypothetical protein